MEKPLHQGDRVSYRSIGADRVKLGTVRKPMHILTARLEEIPVYIVDSDEEDPVILGDGEILEKLPPETTDRSLPSSTGGEGPGVRSVLLLDTDLFFVVKVTDTLKHAGYNTHTVRTEADFARALAEAPPAVALVNTAARGVDFGRAIRLAREAGVPVVAFSSHVDIATQEEARRAGATRVIANSKVASDLPGVLERTLRHTSAIDPGGVEAE